MTENDDAGRRYGVASADELASMTGLEVMQAVCDGRLPAAPISRVLGIDMVEVAPGFVAFAGEGREDFFNPLGMVHGGWAATLLDSCMGCAVHTTMPRAAGYTTLEIKINYIRAIAAASGMLRAEGRVVHKGRRTATAEGRIVDRDGKLYAHGTTTCLIL